MASYTTDDLFPEGGNYKAGDICESLNPNSVVPSWIYTGLQWVPNSVNGKVDPVTGMVEIFGPGGDPVIVIAAAAPSDADGRADGVVYIQTEA